VRFAGRACLRVCCRGFWRGRAALTICGILYFVVQMQDEMHHVQDEMQHMRHEMKREKAILQHVRDARTVWFLPNQLLP
jgi:hypothetical protein